MRIVVSYSSTGATPVADLSLPLEQIYWNGDYSPSRRSPAPSTSPWLAGLLVCGAGNVAGGLNRQLAQPVARHQVLAQARLGAAGFRLEAVLPAHPRRQAHQDRLGAPAALQAEQGAAVVDQV